jgi:small subunit ribosomal protein S2
LKAVRDVAANGGRILFVGTKNQAQEKIAESAKRCGQYYVNHRWLGGMLTNWKTITNSINKLRDHAAVLAKGDDSGLTKKELLSIEREHDKLEMTLGGIKDMAGTPDLIFVIDTNIEDIAIKEANNLNVPVDDALRAIELYCDLISSAVLDGMQAQMSKSGVDAGAAVDVKVEVPKDEPKAEEAPKKAANA